MLSPTDSEGDACAWHVTPLCFASARRDFLLLVEMLNNEEEDCRTAQGGAARQIPRFPNRSETRGSNNQTHSPEEVEFNNV